VLLLVLDPETHTANLFRDGAWQTTPIDLPV